jgi:hypothetical protein
MDCEGIFCGIDTYAAADFNGAKEKRGRDEERILMVKKANAFFFNLINVLSAIQYYTFLLLCTCILQ